MRNTALMIRMIYSIFFLSVVSIFKINAQEVDIGVERIKAINLSGVIVNEVQDVASGNFTLPNGKIIAQMPGFIRVVFTSKPTTESDIRNEIWLPKNNWNGRFLGTGNGGGAGKIGYYTLSYGVKRGFATANTDMGTSAGADKLIDFPERWVDFGYRATHEMTCIAKMILQVYYQRSASYSYFVGISTGGQQALMEAQRFPEDYNGIIAGAPANNRTHLHTFFIWNLIANHQGQKDEIISQKKMSLFQKLVMKDCQGKDGGAPGDSYLTDPRLCQFNFELLPQCDDKTKTDSCFSQTEIATLKKLYSGPINPRTGERIYAPLPLGASKLLQTSDNLYLFKWIFGADFDYKKFDFDRDVAKVDSILAPILNANDPNLNKFRNMGGKLIMFTGTVDQLVPYPDAINYYERVIACQGGLNRTKKFFRFFLVPGMDHGSGGPGANDFGQTLSLKNTQDNEHDILTALVSWVENDAAPDKIIATSFDCSGLVKRECSQRPIYPYPEFPAYIGGDPNSSASFERKVHHRKGVLIPSSKYLK